MHLKVIINTNRNNKSHSIRPFSTYSPVGALANIQYRSWFLSQPNGECLNTFLAVCIPVCEKKNIKLVNNIYYISIGFQLLNTEASTAEVLTNSAFSSQKFIVQHLRQRSWNFMCYKCWYYYLLSLNWNC